VFEYNIISFTIGSFNQTKYVKPLVTSGH
jgi:hypothetical protein